MVFDVRWISALQSTQLLSQPMKMAFQNPDNSRAYPQRRGKCPKTTFTRTGKANEASPTTASYSSTVWYTEHWHDDRRSREHSDALKRRHVHICSIQELKNGPAGMQSTSVKATDTSTTAVDWNKAASTLRSVKNSPTALSKFTECQIATCPSRLMTLERSLYESFRASLHNKDVPTKKRRLLEIYRQPHVHVESGGPNFHRWQLEPPHRSQQRRIYEKYHVGQCFWCVALLYFEKFKNCLGQDVLWSAQVWAEDKKSAKMTILQWSTYLKFKSR